MSRKNFHLRTLPRRTFLRNVAMGNLLIQIDLNQITGIIFGSSTRLELLTNPLVILVNSIFDDIIHHKKLG